MYNKIIHLYKKKILWKSDHQKDDFNDVCVFMAYRILGL